MQILLKIIKGKFNSNFYYYIHIKSYEYIATRIHQRRLNDRETEQQFGAYCSQVAV